MKKVLYFFFLLLICLIPNYVHAETYYFDYSDYYYSDTEILETNEVEVERVFKDDRLMYRYRTRNYLTIPDEIIVWSKYFKIIDNIITNISLDEIEIIEYYDTSTMNHCESSVDFVYKDIIIPKKVKIEIENYINVPNEIIVNNYNFNILDYVETDINNIEDIKILGEYDLKKNGRYSITLSYNSIEEKTDLIVDIEENNKNINKDDNKNIIDDDKPILTNNYIENKYIDYYSKTVESKEKPIELMPVKEKKLTKVYYINNNKIFYYVSYGFYCYISILLSIFVVRKK